MRVCVIGAGITGLATAYMLIRDGHQVTVIDRHDRPAQEASHANGGQLSYSYVAPLAHPSVLPVLPAWLLNPQAPTRFHPRLDWRQWQWCLAFLRACTTVQSDRTTEHLLRLSFLSRVLMDELVERENLRFQYKRTGKLVVYSSDKSFADARRQVDVQKRFGCEQVLLTGGEAVAYEPALRPIADRLVGAVLTPSEATGDCATLCAEMLEHLRLSGLLAVKFGAAVTRIKVQNDRILYVETEREDVTADAFVLCAGIGSPALLRDFGIRPPIYPLRGFSLTLPILDRDKVPLTSVTDYARKIVYAPLGNTLRAAGMADIVGYDTRLDPRRVGLLARQVRETFPEGLDHGCADQWCGLRPATPTGLPVIGPSKIRNLILNTGHGALGFTLALGSAALVADHLQGRQPAIDPAPFQLGAAPVRGIGSPLLA